jgi:hypothetical protein
MTMLVEHVAYDVIMLDAMGVRLPGGTATRPEDLAYLESFLIHVRNLLGFYFVGRPKARQSDVVAGDYFADATDWSPPWPFHESRKDLTDTVSRKLAHICEDRLVKVAWNGPGLVVGFRRTTRRFADEVPEPYRTPFRTKLDTSLGVSWHYW